MEIEIPQLRIVPQELWDAVQAELARRSTRCRAAANPVAARRSRHLFSGLLICGCCGKPYVKHSRTSFKCGEARKGACTNYVAISQKRIEARVFGRLREAFLSPESTARFQAAVTAEREKLGAIDIEGEITRLEGARGEARSRLAGIMTSIEQGAPYALFKARTEELDAEITAVEDGLAKARARLSARDSVQVDIAQVYARAVERMEMLLGDPDLVEQAREFLAVLIHRIVLTPDEKAAHGLGAVIEADHCSLLPGGVGDETTAAADRRITSIPC